MKKHFIIFLLFGLGSLQIQAQDAFDAMRFANTQQFGTARFAALGGAMGALGGDFSAINVNPAGSAVFNHNQVGGTMAFANTNNKTNFFGGAVNKTETNFNIDQAGGVWVFTDTESKSVDKITFGINYEKTNDFNNNIATSGINPQNSIANYFLSYANGVSLNTITNNDFENLNYREQQAYLGYEGFLINPVSGSNNQYQSNLSGTQNFRQQNSVQSLGYNGKLNFNMGASVNKKYFFGINLNAHFVDFTRSSLFIEDYRGTANHNTASGVQSVRFSNDLYTYGNGYSVQIGAIAKVTESFRVGASYDSPTWYNLNDELLQTLQIGCVDCGTRPNQFFADPDVKMIYPTYQLRTPGKTTASLAYIFGKKGLVSFDVSNRNFNNSRFGPQNDYTKTNSEIQNTFRSNTMEYRLGAEYRIKQVSLRGGYRFEQSPYKDNITIGDLSSYSGGLGYSFGDIKLDMAYVMMRRSSQFQAFSQGLIDRANVANTFKNFVITLLFDM